MRFIEKFDEYTEVQIITLRSLSMSRALVRISSVARFKISSGMWSHVSSCGTSADSSIAAAPSVGTEASEAGRSSAFSGFGGGLLGGGTEDICGESREVI